MMRGKNRASGLVQQTETPAVMTVVDLSRHWTMTMRVVKTANTDHHAMKIARRNTMIATAMRRAVEVTVRELRQQTPSIVAAVATRTSTVHRDHIATEARSIAVATAPGRLARKTNTKTRRCMPTAKRIQTAAHVVNTGVAVTDHATDHATKSVRETARTVKNETATMTMIVKRIALVTKTRSVGGAAIAKLKTTSVIMMMTSTALRVVAARTEIASDGTMMTVNAKTSHLNRRKKRMLLVK
jgi:LmbE family N-acetylglucosaminyl deacetylase